GKRGNEAAHPHLLIVSPSKEQSLPRLRLGRDRRQQHLDLGVGLTRLVAGAAVPVAATVDLLLVIALQSAEALFALADLPAALLVGFGLAGGGEVDAGAGRLDRQGHGADGGLREAPLQGE